MPINSDIGAPPPFYAGFIEDFFNTPANSVAVNASAAVVPCDTNWTTKQAGSGGTTGSIAATGAAASFANPGQILLTTPATNGEGVGLWKGSNGCFGALGSNAEWEIHIILKMGSTSNICVRAGVAINGTSDAPSDGMWVEYDTANANSNSDFTFVTAKSSAYSYATTDSIAGDTSFHHIRIRSTVTGAIGFTIDDGTEFTTTTDVTLSAAMEPFFQVLARTSSTATLTADYYSFYAYSGRNPY
jgi:hypothetical protein